MHCAIVHVREADRRVDCNLTYKHININLIVYTIIIIMSFSASEMSFFTAFFLHN